MKILYTLLLMSLVYAKEIEISISKQKLFLINNDGLVTEYNISSSAYGEGSLEGSYKTPLGKHIVKKMIGQDVPYGGRLIGRVYQGEIYPIYFQDNVIVQEDVVQSRIIWLDGLEEGVNRGAGIDSFQRYIYIHGTPEEWRLGQKASKGCIRMSNKDVIELFSLINAGTLVNILP